MSALMTKGTDTYQNVEIPQDRVSSWSALIKRIDTAASLLKPVASAAAAWYAVISVQKLSLGVSRTLMPK